MSWFIAEIVLKIFTAIICSILLLIAIPIVVGKILFDGVWYGDWHEDYCKHEIPELFRRLWEHFKSPIFD